MTRRSKSRSVSKAAKPTPPPPVHPLIVQAEIPAAQRERFDHEVAVVANPYGEVVQAGEFRRHKAVRRVPHFEALYRRKAFDRTVFTALEWYAGQWAQAQAGMFKCGLDTSGVGGSTSSHIPTSEARMQASSNIEWALSAIPGDARYVFMAVMHDEATFDEAARVLYPSISADAGKRKASAMFKLAANYLLLGVGGPLRLHAPGESVDLETLRKMAA